MLLYHEVQESRLCGVHCINTVLQGPFFSEFDLADMASDLDHVERQLMFPGACSRESHSSPSEKSHNVSLAGDFSIQVLQRAMEVWDLLVIPLESPVGEAAQMEPNSEKAFICHMVDHWFCIRKLNEEWYNFDSLYPAPQHLSKFYLSAYLDSLKGFGWSIFLVRGDFPGECPQVSSEAPYGYGQWLTPEDAEYINKYCSSSTPSPQEQSAQFSDPDEEDSELLSEMEDDDFQTAISVSLMDTSPAMINKEANSPTTITGIATWENSDLTDSSTTEANTRGKTNTSTENLNDSPPGLTNTEAVTPEKANQS